MGYEEEQADYRKQLMAVDERIKMLDELFEMQPSLKKSAHNIFDISPEEEYYKIILRDKFYDTDTNGDSSLMLEYKLCKHMKDELEFKLSETKASRNVLKALNFIEGITPQHVSGRIYEVKDGDGCGTFCLWFMLVDVIIVLLLYAFGVLE